MSTPGSNTLSAMLIGVGGLITVVSLVASNVTTWKDYLMTSRAQSLFEASTGLEQEAQMLARQGIKQYETMMADIARQVQQVQADLKARNEAALSVAEDAPKDATFAKALALIENTKKTLAESATYAETMYTSRVNRLRNLAGTETEARRRDQVEYEEMALLVQDLREIEQSQSKMVLRVQEFLKVNNIKIQEPRGSSSLLAAAPASGNGLSLADMDKSMLQPPVSFDEAMSKLLEMKRQLDSMSVGPKKAAKQFMERYNFFLNRKGNDQGKQRVTMVDPETIQMIEAQFGKAYATISSKSRGADTATELIINNEEALRIAKMEGRNFKDSLVKFTEAKSAFLRVVAELQTLDTLTTYNNGRLRELINNEDILDPDVAKSLEDEMQEMMQLVGQPNQQKKKQEAKK